MVAVPVKALPSSIGPGAWLVEVSRGLNAVFTSTTNLVFLRVTDELLVIIVPTPSEPFEK